MIAADLVQPIRCEIPPAQAAIVQTNIQHLLLLLTPESRWAYSFYRLKREEG